MFAKLKYQIINEMFDQMEEAQNNPPRQIQGPKGSLTFTSSGATMAQGQRTESYGMFGKDTAGETSHIGLPYDESFIGISAHSPQNIAWIPSSVATPLPEQLPKIPIQQIIQLVKKIAFISILLGG